jgi:hypothetical protein
MTSFLGGSAYTMATGIADGFHSVSERTFRTMSRGEIEQMAHELDRHLREIRGEQPSLEDIAALQHRNRRIQRLNTALMVLRAYRLKVRV